MRRSRAAVFALLFALLGGIRGYASESARGRKVLERFQEGAFSALEERPENGESTGRRTPQTLSERITRLFEQPMTPRQAEEQRLNAIALLREMNRPDRATVERLLGISFGGPGVSAEVKSAALWALVFLSPQMKAREAEVLLAGLQAAIDGLRRKQGRETGVSERGGARLRELEKAEAVLELSLQRVSERSPASGSRRRSPVREVETLVGEVVEHSSRVPGFWGLNFRELLRGLGDFGHGLSEGLAEAWDHSASWSDFAARAVAGICLSYLEFPGDAVRGMTGLVTGGLYGAQGREAGARLGNAAVWGVPAAAAGATGGAYAGWRRASRAGGEETAAARAGRIARLRGSLRRPESPAAPARNVGAELYGDLWEAAKGNPRASAGGNGGSPRRAGANLTPKELEIINASRARRGLPPRTAAVSPESRAPAAATTPGGRPFFSPQWKGDGSIGRFQSGTLPDGTKIMAKRRDGRTSVDFFTLSPEPLVAAIAHAARGNHLPEGVRLRFRPPTSSELKGSGRGEGPRASAVSTVKIEGLGPAERADTRAFLWGLHETLGRGPMPATGALREWLRTRDGAGYATVPPGLWMRKPSGGPAGAAAPGRPVREPHSSLALEERAFDWPSGAEAASRDRLRRAQRRQYRRELRDPADMPAAESRPLPAGAREPALRPEPRRYEKFMRETPGEIRPLLASLRSLRFRWADLRAKGAAAGPSAAGVAAVGSVEMVSKIKPLRHGYARVWIEGGRLWIDTIQKRGRKGESYAETLRGAAREARLSPEEVVLAPQGEWLFFPRRNRWVKPHARMEVPFDEKGVAFLREYVGRLDGKVALKEHPFPAGRSVESAGNPLGAPLTLKPAAESPTGAPKTENAKPPLTPGEARQARRAMARVVAPMKKPRTTPQRSAAGSANWTAAEILGGLEKMFPESAASVRTLRTFDFTWETIPAREAAYLTPKPLCIGKGRFHFGVLEIVVNQEQGLTLWISHSAEVPHSLVRLHADQIAASVDAHVRAAGHEKRFTILLRPDRLIDPHGKVLKKPAVSRIDGLGLDRYSMDFLRAFTLDSLPVLPEGALAEVAGRYGVTPSGKVADGKGIFLPLPLHSRSVH